MRRFRWNQPCAADSCWLPSPGNTDERGMVPGDIHAKAAEAAVPGSEIPSARQCTSQWRGDDSPHERLLITAKPCRRVASAGPGGRPQPVGGDVKMG